MNYDNRTNALLADVVIFAMGSLGSRIVLFFLVPLYTNVLSTDQYGISELIISVGQIVFPIVSLDIHNALFRFGLMYSKKQENVLLSTSIIFTIGSALTIFITPLFQLYTPLSEWKWYLCAYIITLFLNTILLAYLKVKNKNVSYSVLAIAQAMLLAVLNIVFLAFLKLGIKGYVLSTIISTGITAIIAACASGAIKDLAIAKFEKPLLIEMIRYSTPLVLNDISWWMIYSSDKIMIEMMLNASLLGIYTAASKIPSLLSIISTIFIQAWNIAAIKEYDTTNDGSFYSRVFKIFLVVMFGACLVINTFVRTFLKIYVGTSFLDAARYVPILLLSAVFSAFSGFIGALFGAVKKSKNVMITTIIAGIVNIIVNYIFINMIGVYGAAIGTLTAYVVITIIRMGNIRKYISIDFSFKLFLILFGIATIQVIFVTMDYYVLEVSILVLLIFFFLCKKEILQLIKTTRNLALRFLTKEDKD